jgi:hypothetical protein
VPETHADAFAGAHSAGRFASSELWKDEAAEAARGESIEEASWPTRRTTFFADTEIHSPNPASGAVSTNLSTAVETRVDIAKIPAQRMVLVA